MNMNSIGESVVSGVITNRVDGLMVMMVSRLNEEIRLAWGVNEELKELQREFTRLRASVASFSGKPITNPLIGDWLKQVKEVADEANTLLDEWSYDVLRRQSLSSSSGCCDMDKLVIHPISRFTTGLKLRNLSQRISSKVYAEANKLGIRPAQVGDGDVGTSSQQIQDQERALFEQRQNVDHELMVGRDDDETRLVQLLCDPTNSNTDLTVVGIVGMAGLGKTTLSKRISKESTVTNYFNSLIIWLGVSRSFALTDGLNKMADQLFYIEPNKRSKRALILMIQEKLKGNKYLLILDDVWDSPWWKSLEVTLKEIGGSKGSVVLVTSRNKRAIEGMETYNYDGEGNMTIMEPYIHQLQELGEVDSWNLFMKRIPNVNNPLNNERAEVARRMVKKCGGVPLAIKVLAGLLTRDQRIGRWREIEESDLWRKEDEYGILPSLKLSFNYLPSSSLKECFAYCSIFREDEVIVKDKLICMWMAHGFLQSDNEDEIMEDKGEEYCKILLNNSLLQEAEKDKYGNVETFKMQDLVWSLACVVSKGDIVTSNSKLQTCNYNHSTSNPEFLLYLRVLSIKWTKNENLEWGMVGSLKHLRYLELQADADFLCWNGIRRAPIKPYHLQTLWITSFIGLDYLHSPPSSLAPFFMNGIGDLVNLRHIICTNVQGALGIPEGLGRLTALQTLPPISLRINWGGKVSELGLLNNLRGALKICHLDCIKSVEDASSIFLGGKKNLERLTLWFQVPMTSEEKPYQNEVLEAMQPHSNLKMLKIHMYQGTTLPTWLAATGSPLNNLVSLKLKYFQHAVGELKIENFKHLRFLTITHCYYLRISFPDHGFQCCKLLEKLKLVGNNVSSYLVDLSPLSKLRYLYIRQGQTGSEIVGLGSLPCLKELETDQLLPAKLDEHSPLCNSLQILTLHAPREGDDDAKTFSGQLQHLVALQRLEMAFHTVETIPEWMGYLTSLRWLKFSSMDYLKHLPSQATMKRLFNLSTFHIRGCPFLTRDIEYQKGEWFKINHIPDVKFSESSTEDLFAMPHFLF